MKTPIRHCLKTVVFSLLVSAALLPTANAAHRRGAFSIGPTANFMNVSRKYNVDNTWFPGIQAGYDFSANTDMRLNYGHLSARQAGDAGSRLIAGNYMAANGDYYFHTEQALQPFVTGGVGVLHFNPSGDDANDSLNAIAGGGLNYFFEPNVAGTLELNDVYTPAGSKNSVIARVGVLIFLGAEPPCKH